MTDRTALSTRIRTDHSVDTVRLRYIAAQAENFTTVLDDLHSRLATATLPLAEDRHITAIVEQAAAAAEDLAITAAIAADTITTLTWARCDVASVCPTGRVVAG
ncbi:MAG: hypothetical protein GEV28_00645 [Actinophytocola sp.]|uniref:hypothetical protein n=1 Tax=Actinophytocola sp. TaxID=1872138 RepID=UPI001321DA7C|nr:hypothetical protein [Actinophytocola sp.]MPZ78977.1 hypothetical protein [Actinophytocola sp.]